MFPSGHIWKASQHQEPLYLRYNMPPWLYLGAVSGCPGTLGCLANNVPVPEKLHKFLDVDMDSFRVKLSSCFLLGLIKMLSEGGNIVFKFIVQLQLSCLSPSAHPSPIPTPLPQSIPCLLVHAHESSICVHLLVPSCSFPSLSPSTSPLVTISLFLISKSLVLFC